MLSNVPRFRFAPSTRNLVVAQYQPSQARTLATVLRRHHTQIGNSSEATEMYTQETGRCARPRRPCARVSKEASSTGVKVSFQESPSDQRCCSRQAWNQEVLHELRRARNPYDWTLRTLTYHRLRGHCAENEGHVSLTSFIKSQCVSR